MVFASGLAELGLAFLIGVTLANYFKFKAKKGLNWLALAGVWFLFAGTFNVATLYGPDILSTYIGSASTWAGIQAIFAIIGWIFALIGTLFVAYEILAEK